MFILKRKVKFVLLILELSLTTEFITTLQQQQQKVNKTLTYKEAHFLYDYQS